MKRLAVHDVNQDQADDSAEREPDREPERADGEAFGREHGTDLPPGHAEVAQYAELAPAGEHQRAEAG